MKMCLFTALFLLASNCTLQSAEPLPKRDGTASHTALDVGQPVVNQKTIADLIDWIVSKTDWQIKDLPKIAFVSPAQLNKMQFGRSSGSNGITCRALYINATQTICLSKSWNPRDIRDRSYLLHELVHHLQILNHVEVACDNGYETAAYQLQFDWLREQGIADPQAFLGIGGIALMMLTQCPLYRACEFLPEGCRK